MTREAFEKQKWGAGMLIKYREVTEDSTTELISDVVSVDFDEYKVGVYLPVTGDLVYLPCEKCTILVDFKKK